MNYLVFVAFAVAVAGLIFLFKKLKFSVSEATFAKLVIAVIDLVNAKLPAWKFSGELSAVVKYTTIALEIAIETENLTEKDQFRDFVFKTAEELCVLNEIVIDDDFKNLLSAIVDAVIEVKK